MNFEEEEVIGEATKGKVEGEGDEGKGKANR